MLTSAFCTASILSSDYTQVLAGTNDIETLQDGAQWRTVDWIVQHPSWDSSRTRYALSLLHVSSPFNITATVKPVHVCEPHGAPPLYHPNPADFLLSASTQSSNLQYSTPPLIPTFFSVFLFFSYHLH